MGLEYIVAGMVAVVGDTDIVHMGLGSGIVVPSGVGDSDSGFQTVGFVGTRARDIAGFGSIFFLSHDHCGPDPYYYPIFCPY